MPRRPDAWLEMSADPEGPALDDALLALVSRLERARDAAAARAGRPPLGLREVELAPGDHVYLCAFDGPAFLCVDERGEVVSGQHVVHRVASMSLVWEQLEAEVDGTRMEEVAETAGRVLALTDTPAPMCAAIAATAEHIGAVVTWRVSPLRATASLGQVDVLFALHERATREYARFVQASEPLAADQDRLDADLTAALGAFERAAIAAGLGARLADRLGGVVGAAGQAADEIVAAQLVVSGGSR